MVGTWVGLQSVDGEENVGVEAPDGAREIKKGH